MNKLIHKGFFKEMFRQLRVAGLVSAGILMIGNISKLLSIATNTFVFNTIPGALSIAGSMMLYVYVMGFVMTFIAFGWLNKRATSDYYHSIPVTRTQLYFSSVAAVLLWMFIGVTAYALVNVLLYLVTGSPCNYLLYLGVYINMLIGCVEVVGAVSLACSISGTRFVNFVAACVILFMPRFLLTVLSGFILQTPAGDALYPSRMCWLFDPTYNIFGCPYGIISNSLIKGGSYNFANVGAMIYTLVYSLILVILGWLSFRKRKSEAAGIPTTNKLFQAIIRIAFGLPLILVFALLIISGNPIEEILVPGVLLILFAFVFYCLYELISTKSSKKMVKSMPLFLVCLGIGALYLIIPTLITKSVSSVKLKPENIKSYQFVNENDAFDELFNGIFAYNSYRDVMEPEIKYTDEQGIKIISDGFNRWKASGESGTCAVKINRKFGSPITIDLYLTAGEEAKLDAIKTSNEEYRKMCLEIPEGQKYFVFNDFPNTTIEQAKELGKIFIDEYNSLSEGDKAAVSSDYYSNASFTMLGCKGAKNYANVYQLTDKLPKTRQAYFSTLKEVNAKDTMEKLAEIKRIVDTANPETDSNFMLTIGGAVEMELSSWNYWDYSDDGTAKIDPEMKSLYSEVLRIITAGKPSSEGDSNNTIMVSGYIMKSYLSENMGLTAITVSEAEMDRLIEIAQNPNMFGYYDLEDVAYY